VLQTGYDSLPSSVPSPPPPPLFPPALPWLLFHQSALLCPPSCQGGCIKSNICACSVWQEAKEVLEGLPASWDETSSLEAEVAAMVGGAPVAAVLEVVGVRAKGLRCSPSNAVCMHEGAVLQVCGLTFARCLKACGVGCTRFSLLIVARGGSRLKGRGMSCSPKQAAFKLEDALL